MKKATTLNRILIILLLAAVLCSSALADTATPSPEPTAVTPDKSLAIFIPKFSRHERLPNFKNKLYKLGYYTAMASDENIGSDFLDPDTMNAVYDACAKNNLLREYSDSGINYTVWDAVMNDRLAAADTTPAPTQTAYAHISYNHTGQAVLDVQNKLLELSYPLAGGVATGVYDTATIDVIKIYCQYNSYPYDQAASNGLTPAFQKRLLEQESVSYYEVTPTPAVTATPEPTSVPSIGEKLRGYFSGSSNLLGLQVSNVVLWLISFGLIAGCVLAVLYFFSPADANSNRPGSDKPTRRQIGNGRLEFTIEYKGIVQTYRCNIDHALKIGRNVGSFPLHMQDTQISRKHCEIYYFDRCLRLRDYSSNGTLINGRICSREEYMLHSGDVIQIGDHIITIRF